jgi:hypothetical protein
MSWDDLLARSRWVVVLGEAGNGKSTEFRWRAEVLRQRHQSAFFIDITALARDGLPSACSRSEDLDAWRASNGEAVFFLDSLDEAQLRRHSMHDVLLKLSAYAGNEARKRLRVVVSCRVSDWSDDARREMVDFVRRVQSEAHQQGEELNGELEVVQLVPLDDEQIRRLAGHLGCSDAEVDAFLAAVRAAGAQPFVGRPLDVEWMLGIWQQQGKLGTLTEIVEANIRQKLAERRPKSCPPSALTVEKANEGLRCLAGIAVLTGRWSFLVPGYTGGSDDTIDPHDVLTDWRPADINDLLERAIFDEATYGCVRIHHRTVQEYLAATWLRKLRAGGMAQRDLDRLLFREFAGRTFIPAHLASTVAWLSQWEPRVRERIIETDPEVLVAQGDPEAHPVEVRERVLEGFLAILQWDQRFRRFDDASIRRFAPALEEAIVAALEQRERPWQTQFFLMNLAGKGGLRKCATQALAYAADPTMEGVVRSAALRAASELATDDQKRDFVAHVMDDPSEWDQDAAGSFIHNFYPTYVSAAQLGQLLRRVHSGRPSHMTAIKSVTARSLPEAAPLSDIPRLLLEFIKSIQQAQADTGWLWNGLLGLMRVAVEAMNEMGEPADELSAAFRSLYTMSREDQNHFVDASGLRAAIAHKYGLRRWLFWQEAELYHTKNSQWPTHPVQLQIIRFPLEIWPGPAPDDIAWLYGDCANHHDAKHRDLATATLRLLAADAHVMEKVVCRAELGGNISLLNVLWSDLSKRYAPQQLIDPLAIKIWENQWNAESERMAIRQHNVGVYLGAVGEIRNGTSTYLLYHILMQVPGDNLEIDVARLHAEFGDVIAAATLSGLLACWRNGEPTYHFEQENRNSIPDVVTIGLAGLQIEFAGNANFGTLNRQEVELATKYAVRQLNGFPGWFEGLAATHPRIVAITLAPAIDADIRLAARDNDLSDLRPEVLCHHHDMPAPIRPLVAGLVLTCLQQHSPSNMTSLEDALTICSWLEPTSEFMHLCVERLDNADNLQSAILWWRAIARFDPAGAVYYLRDFTDLTESDEDLHDVVEALAAGMVDWQSGVAVPKLAHDTEALEVLIPIVYGAVRPRAVAQGQMSRMLRPADHAWDFRRGLFGHLETQGTPEAVAALERLARDPRMASEREELLIRARSVAQHSIAALPMTPKEAQEWSQTHAMVIRSSGDLYRAVIDRLDDIREHIETGELSDRAIYHGRHESDFQKHIARELDHWKNVHGYVISREEEVDREKIPDIRVAHSACNGHPVSIEIKVYENWSFPALQDALHRQLVGQYLRADKSRHGILLLCSRPAKAKKAGPGPGRKRVDGKMIGFREVVARLQVEANMLVRERSDIDALSVVGIDYH